MRLAAFILLERGLPLVAALLFLGIGSGAMFARPQALRLDDFRPHGGKWQTAAEAALSPRDPGVLQLTPGSGLIVNGAAGRTTHLQSWQAWGDIEMNLEYLVPGKSNSAVYVMGRYEVQLRGGHGLAEPRLAEAADSDPRRDEAKTREGAPPRVEGFRPAGEWQSLQIIFRAPRFDEAGGKVENARFVQVVRNGVVVQQDVEVSGPAQAAYFDDERPVGPLVLQGDHGAVAFRQIWLRPLDLSDPVPAEIWRPIDLENDFDLLLGHEVPGARIEEVVEISDGKILGMYRWQRPGPTPTGLVVSRQRFSHFDVEFEIQSGERGFEPRLGLPKNAGFLYHIQHTARIWPPCAEVQGMEGKLGDHFSIRGVHAHQLRADGQLVEVPRREFGFAGRRFDAHRPGWNTVRVEVRGDAARYFVIDRLVNEIRQMVYGGVPCTAGFFGFQIEFAEVTYRNLRLRSVSPRTL